MENDSEPISVPPAESKHRGMGILFQIAALVLAFPILASGIFQTLRCP